MLQNYSAREMQKSANAHKKESFQNAKSFALQLLACVQTSRDALIAEICAASGVPSISSSRSQLEKTDFFANCRALLPRTSGGLFVALSPSVASALRFDSPQNFENLENVHADTVKIAAGADAITEKYIYYVEILRKVPVKIQRKYIDAQTKKIVTKEENKTDENGKTIYKEEKVKKYICEDSRKYTFSQIYEIFSRVAGIPSAIAAQKIAEARERLEKTIAREAATAERLQAKAEKAARTADEMRQKAAKASEAAKEKANKNNISIEAAKKKASEAATKAAKAKADADAARAKVEARKKTNTKTKASEAITK